MKPRIRELLHATPFQPFVIRMADGKEYRIEHPDFVLAASSDVPQIILEDPDGSVHYLHSIYREGPFNDWSYRSERSIYQPRLGSEFAANFIANVMPAESSLPGLGNVTKMPARGVS